MPLIHKWNIITKHQRNNKIIVKILNVYNCVVDKQTAKMEKKMRTNQKLRFVNKQKNGCLPLGERGKRQSAFVYFLYEMPIKQWR